MQRFILNYSTKNIPNDSERCLDKNILKNWKIVLGQKIVHFTIFVKIRTLKHYQKTKKNYITLTFNVYY